MSLPTVTVRGTARRTVAPDRAVIHATLSTTAPSRSAAIDQLAEAQDQLGDTIVSSELRFTQVTLQDHHVRGTDDQWHPAGFRATTRLTVDVDDLDVVGATVSALATAGAQNTYVSWTLDDDNDVHQHVRRDAVRDAQQRAEDYADALGYDLGALRTVADPGTTDHQGATPFGAVARGGPTGAPTLDLDPEEQHVYAAVELTYELIQKIT